MMKNEVKTRNENNIGSGSVWCVGGWLDGGVGRLVQNGTKNLEKQMKDKKCVSFIFRLLNRSLHVYIS